MMINYRPNRRARLRRLEFDNFQDDDDWNNYIERRVRYRGGNVNVINERNNVAPPPYEF